MLRSAAHVITRNHVEVHIRAITDCVGQGNYFCHGIDDYRFSVEKDENPLFFFFFFGDNCIPITLHLPNKVAAYTENH